MALAARFSGINIYHIAGYGLALKGVAEVFNLAPIQHLHNVHFGLIGTVASGLLYLGGVWLFIIGYGIFRGEKDRTGILGAVGHGSQAGMARRGRGHRAAHASSALMTSKVPLGGFEPPTLGLGNRCSIL